MPAVRNSSYAGKWYPADPATLHDMIEAQFRDAARPAAAGPPQRDVAYVVPHAGLEYSGGVAAAAYVRLSETAPRRVVLLGFLHSGSYGGVIIADFDAYHTPLGDVRVDRIESRFRPGTVTDHSLEIQLPLIRFASPDTAIVPLYVGELPSQEMDTAAAALCGLLRDDTVLIASTDFTHYGSSFGYKPFPLDEHTPERLRRLDMDLISSLSSLDLNAFHQTLRETRSTMCGVLPVSLLIAALRMSGRAIRSHLLEYRTSGEITGSYAHSVSYAALVFQTESPA